MKPTRHHSVPPGTPGTDVPEPAVRRTAAWILGAPALALMATVVLTVAGAGADWIGAVWLAAVLWTIVATFVQAMWQGLRHRDWSAFTYCELPRNDEDHDWATRSGQYAYLRIRADGEALTRDDERFSTDPDHSDSRARSPRPAEPGCPARGWSGASLRAVP